MLFGNGDSGVNSGNMTFWQNGRTQTHCGNMSVEGGNTSCHAENMDFNTNGTVSKVGNMYFTSEGTYSLSGNMLFGPNGTWSGVASDEEARSIIFHEQNRRNNR